MYRYVYIYIIIYTHNIYIYIIIIIITIITIVIYNFIAGRISPHYLDGKNCNLLPRNGRDTHVRQIKARRMFFSVMGPWDGHGMVGSSHLVTGEAAWKSGR